MQPLRWERRPDGLRAPALVAAFEGWNDAGDAASSALTFVGSALRAERFATIDPEEFYDFQATRPTIRFVDGISRAVDWPEVEIHAATAPGAPRDLVLVSGHEPSFRWRTFCDSIVDLAEALGVQSIITLGSLLADVPHTRPVGITGLASDEALIERVGLHQSSYQGPTGIVGVLHDACQRRGIPSVSLWAAVPHYVAVSPNPKGALALVRKLEVSSASRSTRPSSRRPPASTSVRSTVPSSRPRRAGVRGAPRARRRRRGGGAEPGRPALRRRPRPRVPALPAPARKRRVAGPPGPASRRDPEVPRRHAG